MQFSGEKRRERIEDSGGIFFILESTHIVIVSCAFKNFIAENSSVLATLSLELVPQRVEHGSKMLLPPFSRPVCTYSHVSLSGKGT